MDTARAGEIAILLSIFLGILFLFSAFRTYLSTMRFLRESKTTKGKVINMVLGGTSRSRGRTRSLYTPTIQFYTDTYQQIEFTSTISDGGSKGSTYAIGNEVPVRYDPNNPAMARLDTRTKNWLPTGILAIFGAGFLGFGLLHTSNSGLLKHDINSFLEFEITNPFVEPNPPPVHLFPDFVAAAPLPEWWDHVSVDEKVIDNYDELQDMWVSGTYVGTKLKQSARRMFKAGYLAVLHNADNDFLVAEAISRMSVISHDKSYPHWVTMIEFALDRYFYHKKPINKCANCMLGDTISSLAYELCYHYYHTDRYSDAISLVDKLLGARGHEISGYKQAELYIVYARALWEQGNKVLARDKLKMALGKWKNTHKGKSLQHWLDKFNRELETAS